MYLYLLILHSYPIQFHPTPIKINDDFFSSAQANVAKDVDCVNKRHMNPVHIMHTVGATQLSSSINRPFK